MLEIVINCLRLFVYCYHGDVSDGRHVCTKYHGHTHYYQAAMLEIVINCLRLFVVVIYCYHGDGSDGRHVCIYKVSWPYILLSATYRLLCWKRCFIA